MYRQQIYIHSFKIILHSTTLCNVDLEWKSQQYLRILNNFILSQINEVTQCLNNLSQALVTKELNQKMMWGRIVLILIFETIEVVANGFNSYLNHL